MSFALADDQPDQAGIDVACPLCNGRSALFYRSPRRNFHRCLVCKGIFVPGQFHPSPEEEYQRYLKHNNNVFDQGYKASVQPVIDYVLTNYSHNHQGLDYGSGPSSAVVYWLRQAGFDILEYDPFFKPDTPLGESRFDYITCTEVMEHFRQPRQSFIKLRELLKPGGLLICTTNIYNEKINFETWFYKNDLTHLFFYTEESIGQLAGIAGFDKIRISEKFILLHKRP